VRVGVLTNLSSGLSNARVPWVRSFLRDHPDVSHVETENHDHVPHALALLAHQEIEVLAVNGGDGTLQRVLTEILGKRVFAHPPLIAPLRGGRTNMSALDIGSRRSPVAALSSLLKTARNGSMQKYIVKRPVLRVDLGPGEVVQYGMFFGTSAIYRAIEFKHRILPKRHFQGALSSGAFVGALVTRAACGSLGGLLTPDCMKIDADGRAVGQEEFLLVMVTTLDRLFLQLRPFWGREAAPMRLTAIAAGADRSLSAAMGILCGHPPSHVTPEAGYTSHNVSRVELRLDGGVIVDGELFAPRPGRVIHIEADQRLRFVRT